jgi:hypothetical protein
MTAKATRFHPRLEALEDRALLALFTPTPGTADGAAGSLRDAIKTANTNGQSDVILLQAGTYRLTVLNVNDATANNLQENAAASGDLDLTETNRTVIIQGQGAGVTAIDATGLNDRVFHVLSNVRVVMRDLTVRGGLALEQGTPGTPNGAARGGGIFNAGGDLTLERVVVENNEARGREATGSDGEGGGVHSTGPLFISECTIRNNRAVGAEGFQGVFSPSFGDFIDVPGGQGLAGGLLVTSNSAAVVQNSTISGNLVVGGRGGRGADGVATFQGGVGGPAGEGGTGRGGGVGVRNGSTLTLIKSTVSSNTATGGPGGTGGPGTNGGHQGAGGAGGVGEGGGVAVDASTLSLFNTTVAAGATFTSAGGPGAVAGGLGQTFGGGLRVVDDAAATVNSTSSLFADNAAGVGPDVSGLFDAATRTLVENGAGIVGITVDGGGNLIGADARLGPLAFNGGPTATHALLPGSAAIDGGTDPLGLAFDQRGPGFPRSVGGGTDIGAFEAPLSLPVKARAVVAALVTRKVKARRLFFVRLLFADTGEVKSEFRSPFQAPLFRRLTLTLLDTDGDGAGDAVQLSARKSRKAVRRLFPL